MPQDNFAATSEPIRIAGYSGSLWSAARAGATGPTETPIGHLNVIAEGVDPSGRAVPLSVSASGGMTASDPALLQANSPRSTITFPAQVTVGGAGGVVGTQFSAQAAVQGVWVQASSANTASVFVGGSDVSSTKGYELVSGAEKFFPVTNANLLYHISTTSGQKVNLMVV